LNGIWSRFNEMGHFRVVVSRIGSPYGPWERPTHTRQAMSPLQRLMDMAMKGQEALIYGYDSVRDWTHVRDIARGVALLATIESTRLRHLVYNVSTGENVSAGAVAEAIAGAVPKFRYRFVEDPQEANVNMHLPNPRGPLDITRIKVDFFAQMISLIGVSMPAFWIGLLLIYAFAYRLGLFPLGGRSGVTSLILPACSLSMSSVGFLMRIVRVSMLEVMSKEFITTARSKGLSEATVVWKHGLRNATIPIITVLGLQFGRLLGGAVVTEVVFSWPGMGRLIVEGILDRDYPLVQGAILVFGFVFVVINLLIDISYSIVDPRVRYD